MKVVSPTVQIELTREEVAELRQALIEVADKASFPLPGILLTLAQAIEKIPK